jgi:ABC-2 type transport system permease protein
MPLAFTFFLGLLLGGNQQSDYRLPVGIINLDPNGSLTQTLLADLSKSDAIKLVQLTSADEAAIGDQINSGKLAGALIVPTDYSQQLLNGIDVKLTIVANSFSSGGQTTLASLNTSISKLNGALETARLSAQAYLAKNSGAVPAAYILESITLTEKAWETPAVQIVSEPVSAAANSTGYSGYVQTSPGMLVQFAIAGLIGAAAVIMLERKNKTITRLLCAPVTKTEIILGHLLGVTVTVFLQETILILSGQFLFKVNYFRQPAATLLMMLAMALFCGSLGLFFGAISKRPEHAIMWPLIAMFLLTALGGAWFPLETTSQAFYTIGHITPTAWAMDGFQNIILRGLGFSSVLLPGAILLGYSLLFFALAVWRLKFD